MFWYVIKPTNCKTTRQKPDNAAILESTLIFGKAAGKAKTEYCLTVVACVSEDAAFF